MNLTFRTKLAADQIEAAVKIARSHAKSLGFVTSAFYEKQAAKDELLVALAVVRAVAGFCLFHIRRDGVLVIYEIATEKDHLGQGIGRALIEELKRIGRARGAYSIFLKCPEGEASNEFYKAIGFKLLRTEAGKKRRLNIWSFSLGGGFLSEYEAVIKGKRITK